MAATLTPGAPRTKIGKAAVEVDERFLIAPWLRRTLHKVFPDHWSFLLGEIALYSFVVLLLSGTYLTFFFDASMREVVYEGPTPRCGAWRCRPPTTRRSTCRSTCAAACSSARCTTG